MIIILSGEPGVGKTYQSLLFEEEIKLLDMENRNEPKLKLPVIKDKLINLVKMKAYKAKFQDDYLTSYFTLIDEIDLILDNPEAYETIIIDGISDIRNKLALAKWFEENPTRKNPRSEEWKFMNDLTKKLLTPLINMARIKDKHLIFTAQMKDDYETVHVEHEKRLIKQSAKKGRVPATKDYIDYDVDYIVNIFHPENSKGPLLNKYHANFIKTPIGSWSQDITDQSIYEILLEKEI